MTVFYSMNIFVFIISKDLISSSNIYSNDFFYEFLYSLLFSFRIHYFVFIYRQKTKFNQRQCAWKEYVNFLYD